MLAVSVDVWLHTRVCNSIECSSCARNGLLSSPWPGSVCMFLNLCSDTEWKVFRLLLSPENDTSGLVFSLVP